MSDPIPLLFCGDVGGRFDYLFKKVNNILNKHESGKLFKMLLCVGDFFGDDPAVSSTYFASNKVPIPTYILGPTKEEQTAFYSKEVETLDENIIFLGKCGVYTTVEGLRIAYVSGTEGDTESDTKFSKKNIYNLISYACKDKHTRVDLLITYQWPESITNNLETKDSFTPENPSKLLSYCLCQLKPQYHVAANEQHDFERQPFEHKYGGLILGYTRFVGLGKVEKNFKGRSIYALKMNCLVDNLETRVPKTTSGYPFTKMLEIEHKIDKSDEGQYFYLSTPETQRIAKKRKLDEHKSDCWFCFSNPRFEKQYIVHVGENAYLALAKGGIVHMHILISTVSHYPTLRSSPPEIQEEIKKYKESLVRYFRSTNMEVIFYERAFMSAHLTIQCIALTENQVNKFKNAITKQAASDNIDLKRHQHATYAFNELPNDASYFYLEISNKEEFLVHIKSDYFPLTFARETIAKDILEQPIKKDWRKCILDDDDAVYWVSRISKGYKHFAFH